MQKHAFDLGRKIGKHPLASRLFCLVEPVLPLNRLGRSAHCVAFTHPRPGYDPHVLIVPTSPFPALATSGMDVQGKSTQLWKMIELARVVMSTSRESNWQMMMNGGARQDIGQVHGHLIHARESRPLDGHFQLVDLSKDITAWAHLFEGLNAAAKRPENGYSVVFQVSNRGPVTAWITQSIPA